MGYFVVTVYLGCAAGWGCIFTTGLTKTRLNSIQLHEWGHTHLAWDFGGKNILVIRDLKKGRSISG